MATAKVAASVQTGTWTDVSGAAASVAGVSWQNNGPGVLQIAFNATAPDGTVAYHTLNPGSGFYDKNGSAKIWARAVDMATTLCATSD